MIRTYFITSLRNIQRHKLITLLNVIGLAVGLAAGILILKYVQDEFSYDQFHAEKNSTYRIQHNFLREGELDFRSARTFPRVGPALLADFPEVENYCRVFQKYKGGSVSYEDKSFKEDNILYASASFLDMFSYKLVEGDRATALSDIHTALITSELSRKLFGDLSPLGKRITIGSTSGLEEFEVRGVIHSPENSHLKFDVVLSYASLIALWGEDADIAWSWYDFYTYVSLRPETDPIAFQKKLPAFVDKHGGERRGSKRVELRLQPLTDIHLYSDLMMEASSNGDANTVYFLAVLAIAILVIAWINYLNLATAGAMERAKEVGIKKVVGASRVQLGFQFIAEAGLVNLMSIFVSFIIIYTALPFYNSFAGLQISAVDLFFDLAFWDKVFLLFLLGTLVSGIYPAFILSSYRPVKVLKGNWKTSGHGLVLRRILVISQFVASVVLISGTIIVYQQMRFMQLQPKGFNEENILVVKAPDVIVDEDQYFRNMETYKTELLRTQGVESVTITSEIPGKKVGWYNGARRVGSDEDVRVTMYVATMDYDYFDLLEIEVVSGRKYAKEVGEDSTNVLINEEAVRLFGFKDADHALQQRIAIYRDTLTIIGVVKNYYHESPKENFNPTAYRLMEEERSYFAIRVEPNSASLVTTNAEHIYGKFFPGTPFEIFELADFYQGQFEGERKFNNIFNSFSALAIIVASLGLFGLASFTMAQRTKEVGIRKALGSSVQSIFLIFTTDFMKLVAVSNLIAIPIVWLVMNNWLDGFAHRISIGAEVFLLAALTTSMIAVIAVGYHAIKASLINPVDTLRYE